jgi:hypothetical protein
VESSPLLGCKACSLTVNGYFRLLFASFLAVKGFHSSYSSWFTSGNLDFYIN